MEDIVENIPYVDSDKFNWPHEDDGAIWRHLEEYRVFDNDDEIVDLFFTGSDYSLKPRSCHCIAYLVPPKGSTAKKRLTNIPVVNYAIDFGPPGDLNRGFWLNDKFGIWYKLDVPHTTYKTYAEKALKFSDEFIKLHDAVVFGEADGVVYSNFVKKKRKHSCNMSIEDLSASTKEYFDIKILLEDRRLLYDRLSAIFVLDCVFMESCLVIKILL